MSAHKSIDAVQIELHTPSLDEINPINSEPLLQALAHGEIPSNWQINDSIDRMRESIEETKSKAHLNDKGERLVHDAEKLLETAQRIVNERNPNDSIQHLLQDSREAVDEAAHDASRQLTQFGRDLRHSLPHIPTKTDLILNAIPVVANGLPDALSHLPNLANLNFDQLTNLINGLSTNVQFNFPKELSAVGSDAKQAYNLLKEIALYAARSGEFRSLLQEFVEFFHEAFGDLPAKLQEVGEAVKMDIDSKDVGMHNTRDVAKKDGQDLMSTHPIEASQQLTKDAYEKFSGLMTKIAEKPEYQKLLDLVMNYMDELKEKMDEVAHKALEKASSLKDQAVEKGAQLKEQASEKASELKGKAEEEARDVKEMVIEKTSELKDRAKETAMEIKDDASKRAHRVYDQHADSFDKIWSDLRDVVDNFGGKGTFDSFYIQSYNFYARLYNDKAARRYLHDFRRFISESAHNPKSLSTSDRAHKGMEIIGRGRDLVQSERYKIQYNKYLSSWRSILQNFSNDTLVNDFTEQLRKFAADFALDSKGRPDIYAITESLGQIKSFIYPILMKQLENMTVAKIVGSSDNYDYSIDHLCVGIADFVPESFDLRTKNHLKLNVKDMEAEQNNTRVVLDIQALKPHFNDVKFWYRRKSFPHIEDAGTVDIDLSSGHGTRIKVIWKIKSKHNRPYAFSLMEVRCVVDKVDIKIKNAQHDILDKIAASVFMGAIKHEIANGIVNAIVDALHPLNDSMNKWFTTRPIGHVTDKINEEVHKAFDQAAHKANKLMKSHPIDRLVDSVQDRIDDARADASERVDMMIERGEKVIEAATAIKDSASAIKRKAEKTLSEENPGLRELKDAAVNKAIEFKDAAVAKGSELKDAAVEKGSELAEKVKENMPTDMEDAKRKAGELAENLKEKYPEAAQKAEQLKDAAVAKGSEAVEKAKQLEQAAVEKGSELAEKVKENMPTDMEDAKKKAGQLKDAAVAKGEEVAENLKEKYPEAAKKAEQLKDAAVAKGSELKAKGEEVAENLKEKYPEAAKKAEQLKDAAVEKGSELKEKVKENMPADVEDAKKKAGELKDAAVAKGSELKDAAKAKGEEAVEKVKENMPTDMEDAKKKAGQLKDAAVAKGEEVAENLKEKYPEAAKKAEQLKDAAVEKGSELKEKVKENMPTDVEDAKKKAGELKDAAVEKAGQAKEAVKEKGAELKDKAAAKGSELKQKAEEVEDVTMNEIEVKDAPRTGASYAAVASGKEQPAADRKAGKARKSHKWNSEWVKPNKTAKAAVVEKVTITETREVVMEEKIAANPYEALSEENLKTLNKKAT